LQIRVSGGRSGVGGEGLELGARVCASRFRVWGFRFRVCTSDKDLTVALEVKLDCFDKVRNRHL
jgi:hypothetical protein